MMSDHYTYSIPFFSSFQNPNKPSAHIEAYGNGKALVTYQSGTGILFHKYTTILISVLERIC